ncbi:DUF1822 family protein [Nostoc sp. UHCC 0870]|uniref:DUF1822 family protein n=1 Tax=Nostoc sp. UHCC 0870 TaxID=2914041 RepID=UPI001EE04933|nr:DUF1822 family protein [Nostoc sp. UHCC 0870]UKO95941.1 DUF1822 family protein [Nostoc sp. UHCC 0870]
MNALVYPQYWRQKLSHKFVWLEPEHFEEAKKISNCNLDEAREWKVYLNALALLGFEQWLRETTPDIKIHRVSCSISQRISTNALIDVPILILEDFNVYLITVDNLDNDFLTIPEEVINSPNLAAHFYVLLQVSEEEEKLTIYGFLRHDQIVEHCYTNNLEIQEDGSCILMLKWFDQEINNLLLSARFLEVKAIPLPSQFKANQAQKNTSNILVSLSDWLSGIFTEGWQSTEIIWKTLPINLDVGFARSVNKSNSYEISGTKLFDFGILLNGESFALVVNQKSAVNNDKDILVQILPSNKQYLPLGLQLKVTLNYNTSESESQEVTARTSDNAIQLEFNESPGQQFKVEVSFNGAVVTEEFLL